LTSDNNIKKM